ncbi:hypothetical protein [Chitinophaga caseinilytica]|uniref:Uncharacterized protein n=1 Tax=Chitinophaga caseinilytica TaxID=2267521 RepID=A0ABZ2ZB08_9BACT
MKTLTLFIALLLPFAASAIETKVMVRAKARDAKFIGSSLGGAYIIIRNKANQRILAEGKTTGTPGNTQLIMKNPVARGTAICDDQTAGFLATIDIDEPTFVNIEVIAPFNQKQAQTIVSTELWLLPGKNVLGDGIILEIPGFIVDILRPRTHQFISLKTVKDKPFQFQANIVMMCGCVIDKGGLWNSDEMEVKGVLKKDGKVIREVKFSLVSANLFEGDCPITQTGNYELVLHAWHEKTGNAGVDKMNFVLYE